MLLRPQLVTREYDVCHVCAKTNTFEASLEICAPTATRISQMCALSHFVVVVVVVTVAVAFAVAAVVAVELLLLRIPPPQEIVPLYPQRLTLCCGCVHRPSSTRNSKANPAMPRLKHCV